MAGTLKPEDILTPEELAARLKVRKSWVYEHTRSRNGRKPLPRPNMGRYLRLGEGGGVVDSGASESIVSEAVEKVNEVGVGCRPWL